MLEHILYVGPELIDGRWWNLYSDGTRLPLIAGGSDDADGDDDQGGDDSGTSDGDGGADGDKGGTGDDDKDPDGADKLGEPGKRALATMKGKWRSERDKNRSVIKQFEDLGFTPQEAAEKLKELKAGGSKDDQPDADQIREQARREARTEALRDRATDRVEARAGRTFTVEVDGKKKQMRLLDPEDAIAFLRDKTDEFLDGDTIDTEAIDEALKELIENKPRLAGEVDGKKKFDGDADGGARKTERTDKPKTLGAAIGDRLAGKSS